MEKRRSLDRLISTMEFPLLVRWHLYIEPSQVFGCIYMLYVTLVLSYEVYKQFTKRKLILYILTQATENKSSSRAAYFTDYGLNV